MSKPIKTGEANQLFISPEMVTFDFPKCDLKIGNGIAPPSDGGSIVIGPFATSINPSLMNYGFLQPSITNYMDLGSANFRFRNVYTKTLHYVNLSLLSDARYKENIEELGHAEDKLMALRPVSFDFIITDSMQDTTGMKNKVGFLAQELKEVLPYLVNYLPEADLYTVDYVSIIPYLVQAFQEEKTEKDELNRQVAGLQQQVVDQQQIDDLRDIVQSLLAQTNQGPAQSPTKAPQQTSADGDRAEQTNDESVQSPASASRKATESDRQDPTTVLSGKLFQNIPNPFSEQTMIRYELPKTVGKTFIQIYDANGRKIKNILLAQTQGAGQIEISGGELLPGIYTYSLVISGKVADTKRMVVTE